MLPAQVLSDANPYPCGQLPKVHFDGSVHQEHLYVIRPTTWFQQAKWNNNFKTETNFCKNIEPLLLDQKTV